MDRIAAQATKVVRDDEGKDNGLCRRDDGKSKPGKESELLKALLDVAASTRAHPGCASFALYRSKRDPSVVTALERWASLADHQNLHKGAHVAKLMAAMGPVLAEPPTITVYEIKDEIL